MFIGNSGYLIELSNEFVKTCLVVDFFFQIQILQNISIENKKIKCMLKLYESIEITAILLCDFIYFVSYLLLSLK